MPNMERRALMKGAGLGALAFTLDGFEVLLTPRQARAQGVASRILTAQEVETLEAAGEALLPGARVAGISVFVDHQLAGPPGDCLLMARVANVMPPYAGFYRAALAAIERSCQAMHGRRFAQLGPAEQRDFIDRMRQSKIEGWQGPPGPFVYFLLRHDAVDVTFGTVEGIEGLGIPYMAHIKPEQRW